MVALHAYFHLRNQQAFQRLLDTTNERGGVGPSSAGISASGGKSWTKASPLHLAASEVNVRDENGRSVLHLACAAKDGLEYVRILLRHPAINVNIQDLESHWTPLHRALYHGNIPTALLLLQRSDIDTLLKDYEGYTPFDLYNSTIVGTKPDKHSLDAELYTWGANRNAALGQGNSGDRAFPDQVTLIRQGSEEEQRERSIYERYKPILVRQVQMSKLHTVVVTSEGKRNVRVCGLGSGGRLGLGQHTQYDLKTVQSLPEVITSVAVGQDHTLALTEDGGIYSWGLNRFSQLGYIIEHPFGSSVTLNDEPIQSIPRRITGLLKKEFVEGIAACRTASACWTKTEVFTWGTNQGQLGFDKASQPVQVLPRKVTKVTKPVSAISLSDSAMACLLVTKDVICIWNDRSMKINFPANGFPAEIQPYRPPQAVKAAEIAKITSCDDLFAALTSNGELFTFMVPDPKFAGDEISSKAFKPQRVWALRRKFSAIQDVAIGSEGSIIICTEAGHVHLRSRTSSSAKGGSMVIGGGNAKAFKFQRVPYLQRVIAVCANSTGAYGALRADYVPQPIEIQGNNFAEDLATVRPYTSGIIVKGIPTSEERLCDAEGEDSDSNIGHHLSSLLQLCCVLKLAFKHQERQEAQSMTHGADAVILVGSCSFPAHRVILAARCQTLARILAGAVVKDSLSKISVQLASSSPTSVLKFIHCQPMTVLILLDYLYTDRVSAVWDRDISTKLWTEVQTLKVNPSQVKVELQVLARILALQELSRALDSAERRTPKVTLAFQMKTLFYDAQLKTLPPTLSPDVILQLQDRQVPCHSTILRSRSPFFASFFDEEDWIKKRRTSDGVVTINLRHYSWHIFSYVLRYLCCGEEELFVTLSFTESIDDILDFMFDVMAAATEFHLDRLMLLCSAVILDFCTVANVCFILTEASRFHASALIEGCHAYMAANLETLLESRILDYLEPQLVKQFGLFIRCKQMEKSPVSRSEKLVNTALRVHSEWLASEDFPQPIVRTKAVNRTDNSIRLSPPNSPAKVRRRESSMVISSFADYASKTSTTVQSVMLGDRPGQGPEMSFDVPRVPRNRQPGIASAGDDEIFLLDGIESTPVPSVDHQSTTSATPWKSLLVPRVDMRAVMAEAENQSDCQFSQSPPRNTSAKSLYRHPQKQPVLRAQEPSGTSVQQASRSSPRKAVTSSSARPQDSDVYSKEASTFRLSESKPQPSTPPRPQPTFPGLGPVISPSRQQVSSPLIHRSPGQKAWTPTPIVPPTTSTSQMSFLAIQKLQREQNAAPTQGRRSLLEIQQEEEDQKQEQDFLNWWAAEEERIRLEMAVSEAQPASGKRTEKHARSKGNANSQGRGQAKSKRK